MTEEKSGIAILGVFVADLAFRADRMPAMGETIFGTGFKMGPGGKGSNQSVAAARLGARVTFISRLGQDDFGAVAQSTWRTEGITARIVESPDGPTGAAFIYVNERTGENAIIVAPGVAESISAEDVESAADAIRGAAVFVTQLEQPIPAAKRALEIARAAGVATILNPAPAAPLDDAIFALCDYVTPNETETSELTGMEVVTIDQARAAGDALLAKGVGTAVITLGENGALVHGSGVSEHVPVFNAGPVVETTGAGDAFNGGFAVALAEGRSPVEAARFGCAVAGISVTRPGTAPSMPTRAEIDALLAKG